MAATLDTRLSRLVFGAHGPGKGRVIGVIHVGGAGGRGAAA